MAGGRLETIAAPESDRYASPRRAGISAAAIATVASMIATPANVATSVGVTSNSIGSSTLVSTRPSATAPARPMRETDGRQQSLPDPAPCAAPSHDGHRASCGCRFPASAATPNKPSRHTARRRPAPARSRRARHQHRLHARQRARSRDHLFERRVVATGCSGSTAGSAGATAVERCRFVGRLTHRHGLSPASGGTARTSARRPCPQAVVLDVPTTPTISRTMVEFRPMRMRLPIGSSFGIVQPGERVVDDRHARRAVAIVVGERPPLEQRDAHRARSSFGLTR